MAGPATAPAPTTLRCRPRAFPRSAPENAEMIMAMPVPCVIAAPDPWITRDRIRTVMVVEEPASTAPKRKMTKPVTYTCLRPTMSERRPMGRSRALVARAYAMTTHCVVGSSV